MKRITILACTFLLLALFIPGSADEIGFINPYMCAFHENNIIGQRVVSLADGNSGYYIDAIAGYALEMTWKREGNFLYITPTDPSHEQLKYIVIFDHDEFSLVDMAGNLYKAPLNNTKNESKEGYTIDDVLGKWICKEEKQIIHVKPQGAYHFIFEGGGMAMDPHKVQENNLELTHTGTFLIEPFGDSLKLVCIKTGKVSKGTEFVRIEDVVDEKDLYGTWKSTTEPGDMITINESGVHFVLSTRISSTSKTTRSGSSSLNFAGDTLYIRALRTLTVVNNNGTIELITNSERFIR